ncbi:hypothetical protein [Runella slithyformis]|uniref:HK97 gp10 family phage protein n=1 Tax=Runella slithyformis (strain ATCC 29530 / DSM 19594 / LMG 11500 / NCIMB 11436 / LSU 4) TaxID=761193 RepID=A0A7U3ZGH7_RUNSL|nr:hypothetical protein [Runella slithyformis]AEI46806.1 hypothetical protein Runsl_0354 [Runella slithyformis DSM 19594]
MISEELQREATELAEEITRDAVGYFEKAIERAGIVLSGDLKNSFEYEIIQTAGRLSVAGVIHFKGYGRFKDMRVLTYALMPPIETMEDFVEKVGLEKFAYVPGYSSIDVSNIKNAAKRVAWAVAMSRKRVPTVRRKSRSAWYNSTKSNFLNVMRGRMLDRAQSIVLRAMKEAAQG